MMPWQCVEDTLTTRTGSDIAACLGILASLMVRRLKEVKSHLSLLVEILVDDQGRQL